MNERRILEAAELLGRRSRLPGRASGDEASGIVAHALRELAQRASVTHDQRMLLDIANAIECPEYDGLKERGGML